MKQLITLAFGILLTITMNGQLGILLDDNGATVNGELVTTFGTSDQLNIEQDIALHLLGNEDKSINMRRYEVDVQSGTQNYFCWGVCYNAVGAGANPVWASLPQHAVFVQADSVASNFHAYHVPAGVVGSSTYRFVWFDVGNPMDSVWCDIKFMADPVGVNELNTGQALMQVYPNPSLGNDIVMEVELTGAVQNTLLVVYNTLGERLHTTALKGAKSRTVLPTSGLPSGVYFATVERNGAMVTSKRFVVTN